MISFTFSLAYLGAFLGYEADFPFVLMMFVFFVIINSVLMIFEYLLGWRTFGIIIVGFGCALTSFIWFFLEGQSATWKFVFVLLMVIAYFYAMYNFTNDYVMGNY